MYRLFNNIKNYFSGSQLILSNRDDYKFLPAVLEITETPNSPIKYLFMFLICLFFVALILWASFSKTDIVNVAYGKITTSNRVSIIQSLETARVSKVLVKNGQNVNKGDIIFILDNNELQNELDFLNIQKFVFEKEIFRRNLINEFTINFIDRSNDLICLNHQFSSICYKEKAYYLESISKINILKNSLETQKNIKTSEKNKIISILHASNELIEVLKERILVYTSLYDSKSGNLIGLLQAKESFSNQIINIANYNGQLEEADKYIDNLYSEYSKNISIIVSENNEKIQEINKKINELQSSISKNEIKIKNNYIKSNLDGVMTGLSVFDVGQIVMPGQDLGRIVPIDNNFEIDAYVENKDGGFVIVGKNANVKVDMFPFTKFGILNSEVIRVSKDSFDLSDLQVKSRFPQKSIESTLPGGSIVYKNLVFPINLKILSQNSDIGNYIPLTSGMTVSVEIKTGSRLLIEYFLSSLLELKHNSFKEN